MNQNANIPPLYAAKDADQSVVRELERRLGLSAVEELPEEEYPAEFLRIDGSGISLVEEGRALRGDFSKLLLRANPNNLNRELLVRAAKIKGIQSVPTAVDATAGLGEDAFLLAAAGYQVRLLERNAIIAALLFDALRRGLEDPDLAPILRRMELHVGDSIALLPDLPEPPDVVVLDPMFQARQKSGLVKKKFQLLHQLEQPCTEEQALLDAAVSCRPRKIVIKRPAKGAYLAGVRPSYSLKGSAIRYDCVVPGQKTVSF